MATTVRLKLLTGPHKDRKFCFCGRTRCEVGRAFNCFVQLSGTERDLLISRHHCRLHIDPPSVRIGDLGSINGTFINGKKVEPTFKKAAVAPNDATFVDVKNGDLITIGGTTFRVDIVDCPHVAAESEGEPIWEAGQIAKDDCRLPC
jgi:predicted component of type VI protein secretion system